MLIHFNALHAGVAFGFKTMVGIASVTLPGTVLLLFLSFQARYRICRGLGWVALAPVVLVAGLPAVVATVSLRPAFGHAAYDAAVREAESGLLVAANGNLPVLEQIKGIRAEFFKQPQTGGEYVALLERTRLARELLEAHSAEYPSVRDVMRRPFDDRGVSPRRRDEYLRLVFQRLDPDRVTEGDAMTLRAVRNFEARLKLLVDNYGAWRWVGEQQLRFDSDALNAAYNALIDSLGAP